MPKDDPKVAGGERLYAGKYKTPDEMEKGFSNLVGELEKLKSEGAQTRAQLEAQTRLNQEMQGLVEQMAKSQPSAQPQVTPLVSESGYLDENALQSYIQAQLGPIQDQINAIPQTVEKSVGKILEPIGRMTEGESKFFGRDDLPEDFDRGALQKFLGRNPGIAKTHQALIGAGQVEEAYDYAFNLWKSTRPTQSAIDEGKKRDAGTTPQSGGPPPPTGGAEGPDSERLNKLALAAQMTGDPMAQMQYLAERWGDSETVDSLKKTARERGWKE